MGQPKVVSAGALFSVRTRNIRCRNAEIPRFARSDSLERLWSISISYKIRNIASPKKGVAGPPLTPTDMPSARQHAPLCINPSLLIAHDPIHTTCHFGPLPQPNDLWLPITIEPQSQSPFLQPTPDPGSGRLRFDGRLGRHTAIDHVHDGLQDGGENTRARRRSQYVIKLPALEQHCRRYAAQHSCAWSEQIRVPRMRIAYTHIII